jgi:multidrug efflux system membrane fusion protein
MVDGLRIVRSGLAKGERIVVNGLQRVQPNQIVAPVEVTMGGDDASAPSEVAASK